jgi:superfamily I DNA/RNA helicase
MANMQKPQIELHPRPKSVREHDHTLVDVDLDAAQKRVVTLPRGRSALVLGEAGHGKTTVALHRLAHLVRGAKRGYKAVIVVPTEALVALLEPLTVKLGVDVPVLTFDKFAAKQARRAFPDLPKKESRDATAAVVHLKRDPALRVALTELARRPPGRVDDEREDEDDAFEATRRKKREGTSTHAYYGDLQHLFGDRELIDAVAGASSRPYSSVARAEVIEHTRIQFSQTTEEEYSHVLDKERLLTVDRQSLDSDTPLGDARTLDVEDYAVMFELDRLRAEREGVAPTEPKAFDCIVMDEAQELAPLELALLGRSLKPGGTLIVAGDADQQVDPAVTFTSWEDTMRELSCADYERAVLSIGYRCPPRVVDLAKHALSAAAKVPKDARVVIAHDEDLLAEGLAAAFEALEAKDPRANGAVICRTPLAARRIADRIKKSHPCRTVLTGAFLPGPGWSVTWVGNVKGLEFDYVVVPDLSAHVYPDTGESRRALYVAVTRAKHQVTLACVAVKSPILQAIP